MALFDPLSQVHFRDGFSRMLKYQFDAARMLYCPHTTSYCLYTPEGPLFQTEFRKVIVTARKRSDSAIRHFYTFGLPFVYCPIESAESRKLRRFLLWRKST